MLKVPYLSDLAEVRAWIDTNECPRPLVDEAGCELWLEAFWRMDECVDDQDADTPARTFLDWLEVMAEDLPHPVSPYARALLDWRQSGFEQN